MPNITALDLSISEKKNFEVWHLCSYVQTCDPRSRATFDSWGMIWSNLVNVYKEMQHAKYQSSMRSNFREEEYWILPSLFPCLNLWPQRRGQFWPQGYHMYKLTRGLPGHATYLISKLYTFQFQRRSIFNLPSLFLCSKLWPHGQGQFWPKGYHMNKLVGWLYWCLTPR